MGIFDRPEYRGMTLAQKLHAIRWAGFKDKEENVVSLESAPTVGMAGANLDTLTGYMEQFERVAMEFCNGKRAWQAIEAEFFARHGKHKYKTYQTMAVARNQYYRQHLRTRFVPMAEIIAAGQAKRVGKSIPVQGGKNQPA